MKKALYCIIFLASCMEIGYAKEVAEVEGGNHYLLPKFGVMIIDLNEADPLLSIGFMYGYGITSRISVEGEINYGFNGGNYTNTDAETGEIIDTGSYRIGTVAGYGAYRLPVINKAYIKGKLGLLYENVTRESNQQSDRTDDDFGVAGGIGFGAFVWDVLTLELEATWIDKDIIFYSLGTHIRF